MPRTQLRFCKRGHAFDEVNTYIAPKTGIRACKKCLRDYKIARNIRLYGAQNNAHDHYSFGGNREKTIQRDGEKCVICGMTRDEHKAKYGHDITVDHIDGTGTNTPSDKRNNDMSNLQTLCRPCHGRKDGMRRTIKRRSYAK